MVSLLDVGGKNVRDGESPLYTEDSSMPRYLNSSMFTSQGFGTNLDSDTVGGIQAVTAHVGGPNKLIASDQNGYLPYGIVPPPGGVTTPGGPPIPVPTLQPIIVSTDLTTYGLLSVDTNGALNLNVTATPAAGITYLNNGSNTFWITFDKADTVLRTTPSTRSGGLTGISILDLSLNIWVVSVDSDGAVRTTSAGAI